MIRRILWWGALIVCLGAISLHAQTMMMTGAGLGAPGGAFTPTTWNPADATGSTVLTNSNLTATEVVPPFVDGGVRSVASLTTKHNFTYTITNSSSNSQFGLADGTYTLSTNMINNANAFGVRPDGLYGFNGSNVSGPSFTTADVITIAVDWTNRLLWWKINSGAWNGSSAGAGDPIAGTGGYSLAGWVLYLPVGERLTIWRQ